MMQRRLVVNADDLGLTVGVNDAIFDAHELGILTSASLFATAPATGDAARRVRHLPSLGVGVHLALVDGMPTLPPARVPTLVAGDGRFRSSWKPFIAACLQRRVSMVEVERELTAQIERLHDLGIDLTHLDAHKHVHAYPPVFEIVSRLAVRFGIPVVRVPYEQSARWLPWSSPVGEAADADIVRQQALLNAAMWPWARRNYRTAASYGLRTPDFVGRIHTGVMTRSTLRHSLRALTSAVTELMVHPGYVDDELRRAHTRLLESRREELDLLCQPEIRAVLAREGIELVRHDLTQVVGRSLRHVS